MRAEDAACTELVALWLHREPEMAFAEVFCPAAERTRFRAWGALLNELRETLFELSDPQVTQVKTAWWAEELGGLAQGRHRHPLTAALAALGAAGLPWLELARELPGVASDERASDPDEAVSALVPLAERVVAVEAALFGAVATPEASRSLAVHWLFSRLPRGLAADDVARLPMQLFARHGITPAALAAGQGQALLADWARELLAARPPGVPGAALFRRCRHRFDGARLARLAAGQGFEAPAAPATLWRAWRAARAP